MEIERKVAPLSDLQVSSSKSDSKLEKLLVNTIRIANYSYQSNLNKGKSVS